MFKYIGIFLLTLLLVGCSTPKAKFDIKTQTVAYKELSTILHAHSNRVSLLSADMYSLF